MALSAAERQRRYVERHKIRVKRRKYTYRAKSKEKISEYNKLYHAAHKDRINARAAIRSAEYRKKHPRKAKLYYRKNAEHIRALSKAWRRTHPEKSRNHNAQRMACIRRATPPWITTKMLAEIARIYRTCPDGHQVDHVVPLRGKNVCGLHVPWNLRHLPALKNNKKGNRS